jgi:DNA polymerase
MAPDGQFLTCRLPSGRLLRYFRPSVHEEYGRQNLHYWAAASEKAIKTDCNGKLGWFKSWGGKLVENVVQAIARDIMCCGMVTLDGLGYRLVLHTHDEIVAEVPEKYNPKAEEFAKMMCVLPKWADGLPLKAEGFVAARYRK